MVRFRIIDYFYIKFIYNEETKEKRDDLHE